jgi:hypothetical protein
MMLATPRVEALVTRGREALVIPELEVRAYALAEPSDPGHERRRS